MKTLRFLIGGLLALALVPGFALAQSTFLAPNVTVVTLSGGNAAQVIGTNSGRKDFRICNAGTTVVWIWPGPLSPGVSAYELPALASGTTVCFTPPDAAVGPGASGQGQSWNAQSTGAGGVVSFFEW